MRKIVKNILILGDKTNVRWHNVKELNDLIYGLKELDYQITVSEDYEDITKAELKYYDICINYMDNWEDRGNLIAQEELVSYLLDGGRMLTIHNGIIVKGAAKLLDIHGAEFTGHEEYTTLTYLKAEGNHPIMEGFKDFDITEEPYEFHMRNTIPMNIFLNYRYKDRLYPAGWSVTPGQGKLVYLSFGHNAKTFASKSVLELCIRSLEWLNS